MSAQPLTLENVRAIFLRGRILRLRRFDDELVQAELAAHERLRVFVHQRVLEQRQMAFVVVRKVAVEKVGSDVLEEGVAEELEALVVAAEREEKLLILALSSRDRGPLQYFHLSFPENISLEALIVTDFDSVSYLLSLDNLV